MNINPATKKYGYPFLLLVLFVISFFTVRLPLLHEPFGLEEGIFAELIVNRPSGPFYSLNGRINGENVYVHIFHPAVPYELLRLGGYLFQKFLTHDIYLNDALITPRLRIICSFYQFSFWGALLLFAFFNRSIYGKWPVLLIFAVMLSPLAIKTSVFLQTDNTSGVILCGTAALLFAAAGQLKNSIRTSFLFFFAGGFIAGLGKQEWSFALLAGLVSAFFLAWIMQVESSIRHPMKILGCVAAGLLASNAASYLYDPANYMSGLHYIGVFSKLHGIHQIEDPWEHWFTLMKLRIPFIYICFVLLIPILYTLIFRKERRFWFFLISLYGIFLSLGYILSNWSPEPRYFCPSLAVLTVSAITAGPGLLSQSLRTVFSIAVGIVFVSTAVFLKGYSPDRNPDLEQLNSGKLKSSPNTVLYITSGAGWNKPDIDYANNNSPYEQVRKYVFEKYNKQLVRPEDTPAK